MSAFIGRNFFLRSILSTSDQKSFDDLEKDIKDCMQVWSCGVWRCGMHAGMIMDVRDLCVGGVRGNQIS